MADSADRYHRQRLLGQIGSDGQDRLRASGVLLVGCGALGTVIAGLLVRAGVGRVRIVDRDVVERTNLQRQVLFDEADAERGLPKAVAAAQKLRAINSEIEIEPIATDFSPANAVALADGCDVLLDGTDNFETRYLLNDLSVRNGVPYVYGGAVGTTGTQMTVLPAAESGDEPWEAGPCLRCVYPELPSGQGVSCDTVGVLGSVSSMVASVQVTEAIKVLVGDWAAVDRSLRYFDGWANTWRSVDVSEARDPSCVCCGQRSFEFLDGKVFSSVVSLCGRNTVQVRPASEAGVDLEALRTRLSESGPVRYNDYTLKAEIEGLALTVFADGRVLVGGTEDAGAARAVVSRYIGL